MTFFVGTDKQPVILRPLITLTGQKVVSLLLAGSHGWMDGWMDGWMTTDHLLLSLWPIL